MKTKDFSLPDWSFIGGNSEVKDFILQKADGSFYMPESGICRLSIVDFINRDSLPVITKTVDIEIVENGTKTRAVFYLDPKDTIDLSGKYIYQLTALNTSAESTDVFIIGQGILRIKKNIDLNLIDQFTSQCIC